MDRPLQSTARRGLQGSLQFVVRILAADLLCFFLLMMFKLVLFDRYIHVPNMAMSVDDVFVAIGSLALASFWTILLPKRGRTIALVVLNLILTFVVFADLIYFRYFQDLISVPVLTQAGQVESLGDSIDSLLSWKDLWLFVDWPFVIILSILGLRRKPVQHSGLSFRRSPRLRRVLFRISFALIVFATGLTLVFVPVNIAKKTWAQGLFVGNWWNLSIYNVTGVLGFHGYDVYRYANQHWIHKAVATDDQVNEAEQWFKERGDVRRTLESDSTFGEYKGSNVIMVQAEAYMNYVIGQSIGGQEITPNLNALIKESAYFDRFYHQTSQGRTSDADFAVQCSVQPQPSGSVFIQYAQNDFDCLPATLKANNYSTSVFHAYDGGFWNRNTMYSRMKYDTFYSRTHFTTEEPLGWSIGDNSFFRQSADVMSEQKQPFYSFLITLSSHHPYALPASYQKLDVGSFKGTMFGDYLQAVHYVDESLGNFVAKLKQEGLWDRSIFLFYGDHDNSIRDWAPFEQLLGKPLNEIQRQQILRQVPFIVHLPDGKHAGTYHNVGGQLDVSPTILHLLGISTAGERKVGTPLILDKPLEGKKVVFRSGAFTDGNVFYMPSSDGIVANGVCYDANTGETTDKAGCTAGAQAARDELRVSDETVQYNIIGILNKRQAEAAGASAGK
ncbi:sulfatase [Paenibacillus curdlanolyticus YK9]|uniref:Sulfatase n=1 Tax=Paenibacillus curdlanolyticus YK9 TaxID=717606 RepID=E0I4V0_9BACL|nr:LTA synthase family protein [Paenibacillus curdlanolyticus]EFM12631.1 sulfatase [Paenibacillus curdlanolyticus YK9]